MKLNKKIIKKNKKNKKKQKKVVKTNIETVSEKISAILDRADARLIKNITTILGPKLALKLCNQTSDVEETGGINDPQRPSKRLSKLESFLYLIENDSSISENKKSSISDQKESAASSSLALSTAKIEKRKQRKIRHKMKGIQSELNKLCLNQIKNEAKNPKTSNYFAVQNISKLSDGSKSGSCFIKPSKFNISLNNGVPSLTPNYSNALITRPRLDLNQINFEPNRSAGAAMQNPPAFGSLQSSNSPFGNPPDDASSHNASSNNGGWQRLNFSGPSSFSPASNNPSTFSFSSASSGSTPIVSDSRGGVTINLSLTPILVRTVTPVVTNTTNHITNITNITNNFGQFNQPSQAQHNQAQHSQAQLPSTSFTSDATAPGSSTDSTSNNVASLFTFGSNQ